MTACGLWPARHGLVAVVADDDGRGGTAIGVALNDDARWGLLVHLEATQGLDCELVLPEDLLRDSIAHLAVERGLPAYLAPRTLVEAIRTVAGLTTGPPRRTALMLARLPLSPALRAFLRPLRRSNNASQLHLL